MKFHSNMYGWEYVWRDFADTKGGQVVSDTSKENDPIICMHIPVEGTSTHVTITPFAVKGKSKTEGTSASLHYTPKEHFAFVIRTEKGIHQIGKAVGKLQDIQLGDQQFDHKYLIQGTDDGKVRNLFSDMKLRDLILQNNLTELHLHSSGDDLPAEHKIPPGKHSVVYSHDQRLDKFDQLEAMFDILTSVVHRIGAIPALAPDYVAEENQEEEVGTSKRLHSPLLDMA